MSVSEQVGFYKFVIVFAFWGQAALMSKRALPSALVFEVSLVRKRTYLAPLLFCIRNYLNSFSYSWFKIKSLVRLCVLYICIFILFPLWSKSPKIYLSQDIF